MDALDDATVCWTAHGLVPVTWCSFLICVHYPLFVFLLTARASLVSLLTRLTDDDSAARDDNRPAWNGVPRPSSPSCVLRVFDVGVVVVLSLSLSLTHSLVPSISVTSVSAPACDRFRVSVASIFHLLVI